MERDFEQKVPLGVFFVEEEVEEGEGAFGGGTDDATGEEDFGDDVEDDTPEIPEWVKEEEDQL